MSTIDAVNQNDLEKAEAAFNRGDLTVAYTLAVNVSSNDAGALKPHRLAARSASAIGEWQLAAGHWKSVALIEPEQISAYSQAITAYLKSDDLVPALEMAESGISIHPDYLEFQVRQTEILVLMGHIEVATTVRAKLESRFETSSQAAAVISYAKLLSKGGDHRSAIEFLNRHCGEEDRTAQITLARICYLSKDDEKGQEIWLKLLDASEIGQRYEALIYLARIAKRQRNVELHTQYAVMANGEFPTRYEPLQMLVKQAFSLSDYEGCLELTKEGRDRFADKEVLALHVALCNEQLKNIAGAEKAFDQLLASWPKSQAVVKHYAQFLRRNNQTVKELAFWSSRFSEDPTADDTLISYSECLQRQHRWRELTELLRRELTANSKDPDLANEKILLMFCRGLMKTSQLTEAKTWLREGREVFPDTIQFWTMSIRLLVEADQLLDVEALSREARTHFNSGGSLHLINQARICIAAEEKADARKIAASVAGIQFESDVGSIIDIENEIGEFPVDDVFRARQLVAGMLFNEGCYEQTKQVIESCNVIRNSVTDSVARQSENLFSRALASFAILESNREFVAGQELSNKMPEALIHTIATRCHRTNANPSESRKAIIITSTLRPGGAERQFVVTMQGLAAIEHGFDQISAIALRLEKDTHDGFFQADLEKSGQSIKSVEDDDISRLVESLRMQGGADLEDIELLETLPVDLATKCVPLYALFKHEKPTAIQAWQDSTNIVCALAALLAGVPQILLTTCSTRPNARRRYRPYLKPAYKALIARDDITVINNALAGARDYEQWLDVPEGTIGVVNNGLDTIRLREKCLDLTPEEIRKSLGFPTDCQLIGGVMRFSAEKRPELWIQVAAELVTLRPDCRFLLVGDGPMRSALEDRIMLLGLQHVLAIPGSRRPVEPWMAAMDLLFLSSSREGLPNVLLEAQTLGVPVVSTDVGGAGEAFIDGESGILLKNDDPIAIAQRMADLLDDTTWMKQASVAAVSNADAKFGIETLARGTLEYLDASPVSIRKQA